MKTGIFRSTETAIIMVRYPLKTSTTGSSAALSYTTSYGTANSGFTCVISRPTGADLSFTMNSPPTGVTWDYVGNSPVGHFRIALATGVYTSAGIYHASIKVTSDASYLAETGNTQWGGWIDTLMTDAGTAATQSTTAATQATTAATQSTTAATQATTAATQATTAATQATTARKALTNKVTPNSSTAPTSLTVYDDDNTTPLGTRTIANANAGTVSPAQILSIGKLT